MADAERNHTVRRNERRPTRRGRAARQLTEIVLDDLRKLAQRATFADTDLGRLRLVRSISTDLLVAKRFLVCVQTFGLVAAH